MNIHPDDILTFKEVSAAMWRVAKQYDLPLKSIEGMTFPAKGMMDRLGDCGWDGKIRLVLRCTVDGEWCESPMDPDMVWDTAAHELAHLRHMDHGLAFQDFCEELQVAMNNQKQDHKEKVIAKLLKLQAARNGEAELGNAEAAESFAAMINKMLIEYELNPSDLDYARATDNDPVIEMPVQFSSYGIKPTKTRSAWQESLAAGVAKAHLCMILIRPGSNQIYFVGTKSHATVAEYVYGTMVPAVERMSKQAELQYWKATGSGRGANNKALGYRAAWIDAFISRIWERFREAREQAVAACTYDPTSTGSAMIRLDGALSKVHKYINDKFSARKGSSRAGVLNHRSRNHADGRAAGREAANNITLGRRGISGAPSRPMIGAKNGAS